MIAFLIGAFVGGLLGIWIAPHVYLAHAEWLGIWPPKADPIPWEPIEHDGCAGEPEQGMEKAP
jgi:predicted PurR-regulated permease PerM